MSTTFYLYRCLSCKRERELKYKLRKRKSCCQCGGYYFWTGIERKVKAEENPPERRIEQPQLFN